MEIGAVIRKLRLEKKLTQEEMAKRLGVTAPAVNKWEKGHSMPDITLLSPIARLLGTTLDTLLSHTTSLSEEETERIIRELQEKLNKEPFAQGFEWAREQLQSYPGSDLLAIVMASVLDSSLQSSEDDTEEYEPYFIRWYNQGLESEDNGIRRTAAEALYHHYISRSQFDKAEEYLEYFSDENPERKLKSAYIAQETGRRDQALEMYEELLYSGYQHIHNVFHEIYLAALQENDTESAHRMVEKMSLHAKLFEMGEYHEASPGLELAIMENDADRLLEIMESMLDHAESLFGFAQSPLYAHMTLSRSIDPEYFDEVRQALLECLKECTFVDDDPRFDKWRE